MSVRRRRPAFTAPWREETELLLVGIDRVLGSSSSGPRYPDVERSIDIAHAMIDAQEAGADSPALVDAMHNTAMQLVDRIARQEPALVVMMGEPILPFVTLRSLAIAFLERRRPSDYATVAEAMGGILRGRLVDPRVIRELVDVLNDKVLRRLFAQRGLAF